MGEGARLQRGVEFKVLWESQEHMNGRWGPGRVAGAASQQRQKAPMGSAPMFFLVVPGLPISSPCPASCMSQDVPLFTFMVLTNLPKLHCTAFLPTAPTMRPLKPSCCTQGLEHPSTRASIPFAPLGCARSTD